MKPKLIVALGNPLVPEDRAGIDLAHRLPLKDDVELVDAGTDLLRVAAQLRGRELIMLFDAADDVEGGLAVIDHGDPRLADAHMHAHHLSAVQSLDLIRWMDDSVKNARCVWVLLSAGCSDGAAEADVARAMIGVSG